MATYLVLNIVVLAVAYVLLRPKRLLSKPRLITLTIVMVLTLIFDNIMIIADFFYYTDAKLVGLYLYKAPVEDFFYALLAVMIVPALWERFETKKSDRELKP